MRSKNLPMIAACLVAAFLGGAAAYLALSPRAAHGAGAALSTRRKIIVADEFRLAGKDGKISARLLALPEDGRPTLWLYDRKETLRAALSVAEDGHPELYLLGADGKRRATLLVDADGNPRLRMENSDDTVVFRAPQ